MTETKLIKQIKQLREIRPRKDWVLFTKDRILGQDSRIELFPFLKPAYAGLFLLLLLIGLFEFSQGALPGEPLYPLKKISERAQAIFVSESERPKLNLEFVNKRLEELNQIAQSNEVRKLAPAISEFQADVFEAAKNLEKIKKVDKEIVAQTKKLEENKEKVEKVLATTIGNEAYGEYMKAMAQMVENQIKDLEQRTLDAEGQEILEGVKEDFEAGDYSEALIKILNLTQR